MLVVLKVKGALTQLEHVQRFRCGNCDIFGNAVYIVSPILNIIFKNIISLNKSFYERMV